MTKQINWQPEHFPVGTIAVLGNYEYVDGEFRTKEGGDAKIEVTGVSRNGLDSWLITSNISHKSFDMNHSFNFNHITAIIKRGNGPVKIDSNQTYSRPLNLKENLSRISDARMNKNRYYWYSSTSFLQYLTSFASFPKTAFIKEDFYDFFLKQSFVKKEPKDFFLFCSVDKKKAKRFIRQNINRWIMPMKEVRAEVKRLNDQEQEDYYRDMEKDFDANFEFGESDSVETENRSCL